MREITLTRDKTIFDVRSAVADGARPRRIISRSCRLVTTQIEEAEKEKDNIVHVVVVRGNTLIGTLRMFLILLRLNKTQGKFWNPQAIEDAETAWLEYLRDHLPEDVPPDWATVYLDGKPVISTWPNDAIDAMEKRKVPHPLEHKDMVTAGKAFFNSDGVRRREVSVKHQSHPALIIENLKSEVKVKIISRKRGKLEPLFMRIEQDGKDKLVNDSVELATDIIELSNRIEEFHILKQKLMEAQDLDYLRQREIKPVGRDMLEKLEKRMKSGIDKLPVEFQPFEPKFIIPA